MRRRGVVATVVAVALVAVGSTAHAIRRERATDRDERSSALKAVALSIVSQRDAPVFLDLPRKDPSYQVTLRNDAPAPVVVRRVSWYDGQTAPVEAFLPPGESVVADLPFPTCPTKRATKGPDSVLVTYAVAGVERTKSLALADGDSAVELLNNQCQLFRASESLASSSKLVRSRPGEVVVDLSVQFSGKRDTVVRELRAADGVVATVAEALPLTLKPVPQAPVIRTIEHLATVTLRLTDCAPVVASLSRNSDDYQDPVLPPLYRELQLVVQRPGDAVERVNVVLNNDIANALSQPCRPQVPPLEDEGEAINGIVAG